MMGIGSLIYHGTLQVLFAWFVVELGSYWVLTGIDEEGFENVGLVGDCEYGVILPHAESS